LRPYSCSVCQKGFMDSSSLRSHARTHAEERTYSCPACSKCFKTRRNLRQHEATHVSQRPHVCRHCGQGFTFKRNLVRHAEIHTNKTWAKGSSIRSISVATSSSSVSAGLAFKCWANNCNQVFSTEEQVRSHQALVHEAPQGEEGVNQVNSSTSQVDPVSCAACGVTFISVKTLR
jgi:uncharacterized Zn-finger protein